MKITHILQASVPLVLIIGLTGCGQTGPALGEVSGTVTLDGQPLSGAVVTFLSQTENGSPAYGGTDAKGQYTLMFTKTKSGALLGEHIVEIETTKVSASEAKELVAQGFDAPPPYVAIPKKYRKRGALKASVNAGSNTVDFALTSS